MPPRRRAAAPPPIDIEGVRRKLAEGKIVRVGISKSAQFPDGATGRVRHIGDPAVDGEEYVQVELSLNGTRDILPFTPVDLTPATRGRPASAPAAGASSTPGRGKARTASSKVDGPRLAVAGHPDSTTEAGRVSVVSRNGNTDFPDMNGSSSAAAVHRAETPRPAFSLEDSSVSRAPLTTVDQRALAGPEQLATSSPRPAGAGPGAPVASTTRDSTPGRPTGASPSPAVKSAAGTPSNPLSDSTPPTPPAAGSRSTSTRGSRRSPAVAISIATTDSEPTQWKIEARVGAKVALRSGAVAPARVWELVRLLENDALTKAVGSILDDQRKAAQARADVLAAELAQVRAELAELPDRAT